MEADADERAEEAVWSDAVRLHLGISLSIDLLLEQASLRPAAEVASPEKRWCAEIPGYWPTL